MGTQEVPGKQSSLRKLWGMIQGQYGYEPDLSYPLWTVPLFLAALEAFGGVGLFFLYSLHAYAPSLLDAFLLLATNLLISISLKLFIYFVAILPALLVRYKIRKNSFSAFESVFLTAAFTFLHFFELIAVYLTLFDTIGRPGLTSFAVIYVSYKILTTPNQLEGYMSA